MSARRAVFGAPNVGPGGQVRADRVIVAWLGVSTLAASFGGHVVLLDTYLNNAPPATCSSGASPSSSSSSTVGYSRASYDELRSLRPEAVFIGHGHSDHECLAGTIAATTGARLVALPQDCARAEREARTAGVRGAVQCSPTIDAPSFGATQQIQPLGPEIPVTVVRHVHSGRASGPVQNTDGAESLLYLFTVGRFTLAWNDTVGPLREKAPGLLDVLRGLGPVDVQFGAILGLGFPEQGFRDVVDYAEALDPQELYPLHHDVPRSPASSAAFRTPLTGALAARPGLRTRLHWLQDPADYSQPVVFDPTDQRWAD